LELNISGKTKLAALLGSPVSHSKSPAMHTLAFSKLGIDGVYLCFDVAENNLKEAVDAMRTLNVIGFNVTMPNKTNVVKYLDTLSIDALLIGAVNTVKNENGYLTGYNTDGMGFVKSLEDAGIVPRGKHITICGAGGAGRAVAVALALAGAGRLVIFDLVKKAAYDLAKTIGDNTEASVEAYEYDAERCAAAASDTQIFVNCTGIGMKPHENESVITKPSVFHKGQAVADIIYDPSPTLLLADAKAAGAVIVNGLGMLYNQGAFAFKIWTGFDMPLDYVLENM